MPFREIIHFSSHKKVEQLHLAGKVHKRSRTERVTNGFFKQPRKKGLNDTDFFVCSSCPIDCLNLTEKNDGNESNLASHNCSTFHQMCFISFLVRV